MKLDNGQEHTFHIFLVRKQLEGEIETREIADQNSKFPYLINSRDGANDYHG